MVPVCCSLTLSLVLSISPFRLVCTCPETPASRLLALRFRSCHPSLSPDGLDHFITARFARQLLVRSPYVLFEFLGNSTILRISAAGPMPPRPLQPRTSSSLHPAEVQVEIGTLLNTSEPHDGHITARSSIRTHVTAPRRCACRRQSRGASFPLPGRAASPSRGACPASLKTDGEGMMSTYRSTSVMSSPSTRKHPRRPATIDTLTYTIYGSQPTS